MLRRCGEASPAHTHLAADRGAFILYGLCHLTHANPILRRSPPGQSSLPCPRKRKRHSSRWARHSRNRGKFAALLVFGALLTPHLFGDLPFGGYVVPAAVAPPAGPQQLCRCPGGRHLDRTGQARRPAASDESRPGLDPRGFRLVGSAAGGRPVFRRRTPEPLTLPFVAVLIFRSVDAAPGARPRCAASRRVGASEALARRSARRHRKAGGAAHLLGGAVP
jgi:hypothetical protein